MKYEHACIISSSIGSHLGHVAIEDRFNQTLHSIQTVRDKIKNCCVILVDNSLLQVDDYKQAVKEKVDFFIDVCEDPFIAQYNKAGLKSHCCLMLFRIGLDILLNNVEMKNINRVFKLSGRHNITDEFDISEHTDAIGKCVFKKPVNSWISPELKLYESRFFSLHKSNIDFYIEKFQNMFNDCDGTFDIEHSYYRYLKPITHEIDNIWVEGVVAGSGLYQKD